MTSVEVITNINRVTFFLRRCVVYVKKTPYHISVRFLGVRNKCFISDCTEWPNNLNRSVARNIMNSRATIVMTTLWHNLTGYQRRSQMVLQ